LKNKNHEDTKTGNEFKVQKDVSQDNSSGEVIKLALKAIVGSSVGSARKDRKATAEELERKTY
jgi:hypothetical protein